MTSEPLFGRLLVGVTGSVGIYSFLHYLAAMRGVVASELTAIMTRSAQRMVPPEMVATVIDGEVFTDTWDQRGAVRLPHIDLVVRTDGFLVMPATARILASAAHGHADDLLATALLAFNRPTAFVPNMNSRMWSARPTRRNVDILRSDGHLVLDPDVSCNAALSVRGARPDAEPGVDPRAIKDLLERLRERSSSAAKPVIAAHERDDVEQPQGPPSAAGRAL